MIVTTTNNSTSVKAVVFLIRIVDEWFMWHTFPILSRGEATSKE